MQHMESSEIYFRQLDRLVARENFLEKEMLNSNVHHLDVRTGFFDKVAVLAAGSLAVGISFMTTEFQRGSLQQLNKQYFELFVVALAYILLSLIFCVTHNYFVSRAVFQLSEQITYIYKAAHESTLGHQVSTPPIVEYPAIVESIKSYDQKSEALRVQKQREIIRAKSTGMVAVVLLIVGYAVGFGAVVSIVASLR